MRIQRIAGLPANYLEGFYSRHDKLAEATYEIQHQALMLDSCGWADFWTIALNPYGYEMSELVGNAEPLQKRWAFEHGIEYSDSDWRYRIVKSQVLDFKPEIIFLTDYWNYPPSFVRELREQCPSLRLVITWCGAPFRSTSVFRECDLVLSCIPELVKIFRNLGHRSELLDHAFDPRIIERIGENSDLNVDFAFLGSIVIQNQFHLERERLLRKLVGNLDTEIWSDLEPVSTCDYSLQVSKRLAYDIVTFLKRRGIPESFLDRIPEVRRIAKWQERPLVPHTANRALKARSKAALFGLDMFSKIRECKLVLNKHIDISVQHASNMRLFEVSGVGSCLITDWKKDVSRFFEPDIEVVTYRSAEECIEKVRYLLDNPECRRQIALAGQKRTLQDHTFNNRAPQLHGYIRSLL